jgi:hypothetical protein
LAEEVVDEGHEGNGEDRAVLILLLLEVGEDGFVFNVNCAYFLALADYFFELIDLNFSLLHANTL